MSNTPKPEDNESRGFKVQDRRRFTQEGEARSEAADATEAGASGADAGPPPAAAEPEAERAGQAHPPAEINFSTFLISLGTQAFACLGEIPNPVDHSSSVDLTAAKEMIDILSMLKEKTKGNLDQPEEALLDHLLYDLRLKYVERVRGQSKRS
ncbi:MAG TPA: DUF1844 domain-containing protein [Terriglobales bacterium]|nr:DUF1844 domain-containing protein [Terriglobales bacterium]